MRHGANIVSDDHSSRLLAVLGLICALWRAPSALKIITAQAITTMVTKTAGNPSVAEAALAMLSSAWKRATISRLELVRS